MLGRADANFSLSGLKTAVRNEASRLGRWSRRTSADLCAGFQAAVLESTADRLSVGLRLFHEQFGPPRALVAAGGVAANQAIRGALQDVAAKAADHADHSAAGVVHRQRRDDRLGRRRAAGARPDRHHGRRRRARAGGSTKTRCAPPGFANTRAGF